MKGFLPIGDDNGTHAILVLDPDSEYAGQIVAWDHDGDTFGEWDTVIAPSLLALFQVGSDRLRGYVALQTDLQAVATKHDLKLRPQPWYGSDEFGFRFTSEKPSSDDDDDD